MLRQRNRPAHILVKYAKEVENSDSFVTWIEENPLLIESTYYSLCTKIYLFLNKVTIFSLKKKRAKINERNSHLIFYKIQFLSSVIFFKNCFRKTC